jgi:hypothetical protein
MSSGLREPSQEFINFAQGNVNALKIADDMEKENKKYMDSYQKSSIIWFTAAAVSAAISITLFVW